MRENEEGPDGTIAHKSAVLPSPAAETVVLTHNCGCKMYWAQVLCEAIGV